jgi:hypothetical protein
VILDSQVVSSVMQTYPRIATYVTQRYHEVGRFDLTEGKAYIVMAENARVPVRFFGAGNLPCFVSQEQTQLSRFQ